MSRHRCVDTLSESTRSTDGFEARGKLAHTQFSCPHFKAKTEFHIPQDRISQLARYNFSRCPYTSIVGLEILSAVEWVRAHLFCPLHHLRVSHSSLPPGDETKTQESMQTPPNNFWGDLVPRNSIAG